MYFQKSVGPQMSLSPVHPPPAPNGFHNLNGFTNNQVNENDVSYLMHSQTLFTPNSGPLGMESKLVEIFQGEVGGLQISTSKDTNC